MKKIGIVLTFVAAVFLSCNDDKKTFTEQYDNLIQESDSLEQIHMKFEEANKDMAKNHQELMQRLDTMQIQDSSFVTKMVEHDVILKRHESLIAGHQKLIQGHKELRNNFGNLTTEEMEAQISVMKDNHAKLKEDHNNMRQDHDRLIREHQDLELQFRENSNNAIGTGTEN